MGEWKGIEEKESKDTTQTVGIWKTKKRNENGQKKTIKHKENI